MTDLVTFDSYDAKGDTIEPVGNTIEPATLAVRAERIRGYVNAARACIIQIGNELIAASAGIPQGEWLRWLDEEFGWSDKTAHKYMSVAIAFASEPGSDDVGSLTIDISALYVLASPDVPQPARDEAIERAQTGEHITKRDAEAMVQKALDEQAAKNAQAVAEAIAEAEEIRETEIKRRIKEATAELRGDKKALNEAIKTIKAELATPDIKTIAAVLCRYLSIKRLNDGHYRLLAQMLNCVVEVGGRTFSPISAEEAARVDQAAQVAGAVTNALAALAGAVTPEVLLAGCFPVQRHMIRDRLPAALEWLKECEAALLQYDPNEKV